MKQSIRYFTICVTILISHFYSFAQIQIPHLFNDHILDSAQYYCYSNRSFDKANFFINKVIRESINKNADSTISEAYFIKAKNYYYKAINYKPNQSSGHAWGFGEECENCEIETFDTARISIDSMAYYLPYNYSRYNYLTAQRYELYEHIAYVKNIMIPLLLNRNLSVSKQKNVLFISLLILSALIILLIIFILLNNRRKNIQIKLLLKDIQTKNHEIIDSINYAKRLQNAIMTSEKYIQNSLKRLNNKS